MAARHTAEIHRGHRDELEAAIPRLLAHPTPPFAFQRQLDATYTLKTFDRLPQIKAPTLVITGAEDVLIPARNSEIIAGQIPGAKLHIIPAVGQHVHGRPGRIPESIRPIRKVAPGDRLGAGAHARRVSGPARNSCRVQLCDDQVQLMTEGDFQTYLATQPLDRFVQSDFDGEVHFFRNSARHYDLLRDHLVPRLKIASRTDLKVIGSAKLGFSLDPASFPRAFSQQSDIDVLVVDEELFDRFWFSVLEWHYRQPGKTLVNEAREWMRQRRYEVYWGSFDPAHILPLNIKIQLD